MPQETAGSILARLLTRQQEGESSEELARLQGQFCDQASTQLGGANVTMAPVRPAKINKWVYGSTGPVSIDLSTALEELSSEYSDPEESLKTASMDKPLITKHAQYYR
jgi:hypothetical protein